jgi:hypothetical protein
MYLDAIGIFIVACLNALGNHRHRHLALKSGIAIRSAAVNVLYEHVLRLSPKGKIGLTSGEITNLFATGKCVCIGLSHFSSGLQKLLTLSMMI